MNGKNLFRALEYVDDRYLDMVDAAAQEATDMKQKHFSGRKTILYILAAVICVSLLTVTAAAGVDTQYFCGRTAQGDTAG